MKAEKDRFEMRYHLNKSFLESPRCFGEISLVQIGRMHCAEHTVINEHLHRNWFELTIITDGKGRLITNHVSVPVCTGQIYLSFPGDIHCIESDAEAPLKFDFFSFETENVSIKDSLEEIMQNCMTADRRIISDDRINYLVSNAIAEISREESLSDIILESIFRQIVCYLIRGFRSVSDSSVRTNVCKADELCYRIMNYIDTHIYTVKELTVLSEALNYDYSYLSNLFHKTTGDTLQDYYRHRRLETARLLLLEDNLRVGEVAEMVGYSSIYTFSRAFKAEYGVSPSSFNGEK